MVTGPGSKFLRIADDMEDRMVCCNAFACGPVGFGMDTYGTIATRQADVRLQTKAKFHQSCHVCASSATFKRIFEQVAPANNLPDAMESCK